MRENNENLVISGTFWKLGEKVTSQLVSFCVSIVLARLLAPDDYGVVATVYIFISIAECFVTSGLGTSLIQKKEADDLDFSTVFWCNITISLFMYTIVFAISPVIAKFYSMSILTSILRVFALKLPISAVNSIQIAYVSRRMDFKKFFCATLVGTIISAVVGIYMAYSGYGVWALIAQYMTNSIIDTIVLSCTIGWHPKLKFSFERAVPLVNYGWKILATELLGVIFNQVNSFVIGKKYSSDNLAYYTQGKRLPEMICNNITISLNTAIFPVIAMTSSAEEIIKIRRKHLKLVEYILFPMMFGLIVISDKLIVVLMTEKWVSAIPYFRIMCFTNIIGVLGITLVQEIKAIGRSDVALKIGLIKKPIFLVVVLIMMQFGVKAIAWSLAINEFLAFLFNVYPVKKYIGFDIKLHFLDALPSLIMSIIMSVIVFLTGLCIKTNIICLCTQIFAGIIVYICLSKLTKNEQYLLLKNLFIEKIANFGKAKKVD